MKYLPLLFSILLMGCAPKVVDHVVTEYQEVRIGIPKDMTAIPPRIAKNYRTNGELYLYSEKIEARSLILEGKLRDIEAISDKATTTQTPTEK